MGAPGVGKTTLAERVSAETGIYFFQREIVLDCIFGDERDTEHYNSHAGAITKSTFELGIYNAQRGISSIVEAPMKPAIQGNRAGFIDNALEMARVHRFDMKLIYCTAPADVLMAHMKERGSPRDESKYLPGDQPGQWDWYVKQFIDVPGPVLYEHLKVDTKLPLEQNVKRILDYLAF